MVAPRALVTGAAGFVGNGTAAALERLLGIGNVVPYDRMPVHEPDLSFCGDIGEISSVLPRTFTPDIIIHCAGITTAACEADPEAAFAVNVNGTRALVAWCRTLPRPPRFILTSSVAVFGGGAPTVSEASPIGPQSTYGATKVMAEQIVLDATRRGEIDGVVVRLPVTIVRGSRMGRPGAGYLSDLIIKATEGAPFVAPLLDETPIPVSSAARTFAILAQLAVCTAPLPARLVHVPSIAATGRETLAALVDMGTHSQVTFQPDETIMALIRGWPQRLDSAYAANSMIGPPASITEIIEDYWADRSRGRPSRGCTVARL